MENKIEEKAKLKAIQAFIGTLLSEYEKIEDSNEWMEISDAERRDIISKSSLLHSIKCFLDNMNY